MGSSFKCAYLVVLSGITGEQNDLGLWETHGQQIVRIADVLSAESQHLAESLRPFERAPQRR